MRVLFLVSGWSDSRVQKELFSLSKEHTVEVLAWDREHDNCEVSDKVISIFGKDIYYQYIGINTSHADGYKRLAPFMLKFWWRAWKFLLKYARQYDAVHVCNFNSAIPIMLLWKRPKVVYDIFDYSADSHVAPQWMLFLLRKLENRMIRKSDAVIICSETRKEQILPERPDNLIIIHNTPSLKIQKEEQLLQFDSQGRLTCRIAYVGNLAEDRFLKEISEVIVNRRDVELHIGGVGVLDEYFSSMANQCTNIFYYGQMSYPKVLDLEGRCDIMTAIYDPRIPNHKYAAPNKFYESLMLKKPLIMVRNTGMDSFVEQYALGEVIDGGVETFKENFSYALDRLIQKRDQWAEMGERGYQLYETQFSWDKMEKRLLKAYERLDKI